MNYQDPIREYIVNEILKNYIYQDMLNKKDKLKKSIDNEYDKTKKLILQKKYYDLSLDINKIIDGKNKKFNDIIYRRFMKNKSKIEKIIHDRKVNFQELINRYLELLLEDDVESDKFIKRLKYIKGKLSSFRSDFDIDLSSGSNDEETKNNKTKIEKEKELFYLETQIEDLKYYNHSNVTEKLKKKLEEHLEELKEFFPRKVKKLEFELESIDNNKKKEEKEEEKKEENEEEQDKYVDKEDIDVDDTDVDDIKRIGGNLNTISFYKRLNNMIKRKKMLGGKVEDTDTDTENEDDRLNTKQKDVLNDLDKSYERYNTDTDSDKDDKDDKDDKELKEDDINNEDEYKHYNDRDSK